MSEKITLLLRTKSKSFEIAIMKLLSFRKEEKSDKYEWHLGISSNQIVMFDIDEIIPEDNAVKFAKGLKNYILNTFKIENKVIVIRTNHGYHVVSDAILNEDAWLVVYKFILSNINVGNIKVPLDKAHIELSIKYKSTTLRISPKRKDGEMYDVVKVI